MRCGKLWNYGNIQVMDDGRSTPGRVYDRPSFAS